VFGMKSLAARLATLGFTFGFLACGGAMSGSTGGAPETSAAAPAYERYDAEEPGEPSAVEVDDAMAGAEAASRAPSAAPGAPPARSRDGAYVTPSASVKAGEWDDNANYQEFRRYMGSQSHLGFERVDVSQRRFLVVRDQDGKAVPNCAVTVRDDGQRSVKLTTTSSGRAILFPRAEGLSGGGLSATASCHGTIAHARVSLDGDDGVVDLSLSKPRALPQRPVLDLAFVLDTTGSMAEEIEAVKGTIRKVAGMLADLGVDVRVGLVEYRDLNDSFVTRVYPMSGDVTAFARKVDGLRAGGGGDTPENANRGLSVALNDLAWSERSVARVAVLIADAPPHLDYDGEVSYGASMREASRRGIQIHTIAASGMDALGQVVWRQIAQYTGGTNMFVLRGGAGPQSSGGGDPASSCGGTHQNYQSGNLAELIGDKLRLAVAALEADPLRIAGLGQDERAKPCEARIVIAR
jgi:Mg-chelatase subunit ChlD